MVNTGPPDKVVQSMYKWDYVQNVCFLSLSCQTLNVCNEYVDISNHYKGSDKKTNFEYIMRK